jgi:hypothetical protein
MCLFSECVCVCAVIFGTHAARHAPQRKAALYAARGSRGGARALAAMASDLVHLVAATHARGLAWAAMTARHFGAHVRASGCL